MTASYYLRFDDASPFWQRSAWDWWVEACERLRAPGVVALIPDIRNESLCRAPRDESFWSTMRRMQDAGWGIALHGLTHERATVEKGIYGTAAQSEFAGLPFAAQLGKIERGYAILEDHGVVPDAFVAPWHSFDRATVEALAEFGKLPYLVEGYAWSPHTRWGLKWTPCQLWKPQRRPRGLFGICVHPDTAGDRERRRFQERLAGSGSLVGWREAVDSQTAWPEYGVGAMLEETFERAMLRFHAAAGGVKMALQGEPLDG